MEEPALVSSHSLLRRYLRLIKPVIRRLVLKYLHYRKIVKGRFLHIICFVGIGMSLALMRSGAIPFQL